VTMNLRRSLRMSLRQFRRYPVRTALTTVGVVMGVGAVVTFTTLGLGLEAAVTGTLVGDSQAVVTASTTTQDPDEQLPTVGQGGARVFTGRDVAELRNTTGVSAVIPLDTVGVTVRDGSRGYRQRLVVTPRSYFSLGRLEFLDGRPYRAGAGEVVLNEDAVAALDGELSVGTELVVARNGRQRTVTVVGIVGTSNPLARLTGRAGAPQVYAPPSLFGPRTVQSPTTDTSQPAYSWLFVRATPRADVEAVNGRVDGYLRGASDAGRLLSPTQRFDVATAADWTDRVDDITSQLTSYILAVGVTAVAIGAVGIMNLLLVSVSERTRAIGVMRAVGATRRDVVGLFLAEAALIGLLGSAAGVVAGVAAGYAGVRLLAFPFRLPLRWLATAAAIGLTVSLLAGVYPAWRAARLDPVEALRGE